MSQARHDRRLWERALSAIAAGDGPTSIRTLRRLVRRGPDVAIYRAYLGDAYHRQDNFAAAIRTYRDALGLVRTAPGGRSVERPAPCGCRLGGEARIRMALGSALRASGEAEAAENEYRRALEVEPTADRHVALAHLLEEGGRDVDARRAYLAARRLDRRHADALAGLAWLDVWHRPALAERRLRRALRHEPDHPEALTSLGFVCFGRDALDEARQWLERAARVSDLARPVVYLSFVYERQGRASDAEKALERAEALAPGDPHPLFARGDLYRRTGRLAEARVCYLEALRLDPSCGDAWLRIGLLDVRMGELSASSQIEPLERGLALAPQHPWAPWIRAEVIPRLRGEELEEELAAELAAELDEELGEEFGEALA